MMIRTATKTRPFLIPNVELEGWHTCRASRVDYINVRLDFRTAGVGAFSIEGCRFYLPDGIGADDLDPDEVIIFTVLAESITVNGGPGTVLSRGFRGGIARVTS